MSDEQAGAARGASWPRVLWMSNAPWAATGYGVQTRHIVSRIARDGGQVAVLAFYGQEGALGSWETPDGVRVPVYPKGTHPFGLDVVDHHARDFRADVVVSLIDAWVLDPGMVPSARWAPLYPVDSNPLAKTIADRVSRSWMPLVFSRHGQRMSEQAGIDAAYLPHGVDTSVYRPRSRSAARERLGLPADAYLFGMVAANKSMPVDRKAIPQVLHAFARVAEGNRDAHLFLHVYDPSFMPMPQATDFRPLLDRLGIIGRVHMSRPYRHLLGNYDDDWMADAYSAMDCLVAPSMGEGFGVPIIEAQACGTPVIVGGWTAMPELVHGGLVIDEADSEPWWWADHDTYMRLVRVDALADKMRRAMLRSCGEDDRHDLHRQVAERYDADLVHERYWRPLLDRMANRIENEAGGGERPPVEVDMGATP